MSVDSVYVPQSGAMSDLEAWIAGALGSCKVRLYVSNTPYLPTRIPADYTEASFPGYAPVASPAWGSVFINGGGAAETDSPVLTFTFASSSGTATVFGIYVTDSSGTVLLLVVPFQAPVVLSPGSPDVSRSLQVTAISQL